ncbi:hypothetical protein LZ31DRAFT_203052 [Colletotrichum somersetense]|nr:hypothetical protein LZ31DRAFT_203052 [Colletotrichum somersetense]
MDNKREKKRADGGRGGATIAVSQSANPRQQADMPRRARGEERCGLEPRATIPARCVRMYPCSHRSRFSSPGGHKPVARARDV